MTNKDVRAVNIEVKLSRQKLESNGQKFEEFEPLTLAAQVVALCDTKNKLRQIILILKELDKRYDDLYYPELPKKAKSKK